MKRTCISSIHPFHQFLGETNPFDRHQGCIYFDIYGQLDSFFFHSLCRVIAPNPLLAHTAHSLCLQLLHHEFCLLSFALSSPPSHSTTPLRLQPLMADREKGKKLCLSQRYVKRVAYPDYRMLDAGAHKH